MSLSCKIFEHFALQVGSSNWDHKLRSTPFEDGTTLVPKLADPLSFWRSGSTPSKYWIKYSWSGLTQILYYLKMLDEIQYLETRSHHVNKSFIISLPYRKLGWDKILAWLYNLMGLLDFSYYSNIYHLFFIYNTLALGILTTS
jgi:hypothetical protein